MRYAVFADPCSLNEQPFMTDDLELAQAELRTLQVRNPSATIVDYEEERAARAEERALWLAGEWFYHR